MTHLGDEPLHPPKTPLRTIPLVPVSPVFRINPLTEHLQTAYSIAPSAALFARRYAFHTSQSSPANDCCLRVFGAKELDVPVRGAPRFHLGVKVVGIAEATDKHQSLPGEKQR